MRMTFSPDLASKIIDDALPWSEAPQFDIRAFLQRYSLHDSAWLGLHINCASNDSATALIRFDPVWNSSVSAPTSLLAEWPFLLLRFTCVSSIQLSGFADIRGAFDRAISSAAVEAISEEEVVTTLDDIYGGVVTLRHFPLVDALVLSPEGEVLRLSNEA